MKETGKGEGGRQRPSGVNQDARVFMHPGRRGGSRAPRVPGGRAAARVPHRPGTRGRGAPEVGEKRGRRSAHALTPRGSALRGPQEGDTLCGTLVSGTGRGWVEQSPEPPPGAAPAALAPAPRPGCQRPPPAVTHPRVARSRPRRQRRRRPPPGS